MQAHLRYLKQAVGCLTDSALSLGGADDAALASIDRLRSGVLAEIRRLEQLDPAAEAKPILPEVLAPGAGTRMPGQKVRL